MVRRFSIIIAICMLITLSSGCSNTPGAYDEPSTPGASGTPIRQGSSNQPPELIPTVPRDFPPTELHLPVESSVRELGIDSGVDFGNASRGYILAWYSGTTRAKVQVIKLDGDEAGRAWVYDVDYPDISEVLPLQGGSGQYKVYVAEHLEGDMYSPILTLEFDVVIEDHLLPFLYATKFSMFTSDSLALRRAHGLTDGAKSDIEALIRIYEFIVENFDYDVHKAETIVHFYTPDPDDTIERGMGICFDFASLFSAMLRANNIPAQLVIGEVSDGLAHAWNNVYLENSGWIDIHLHLSANIWELLDVTFAAAGQDSESLANMIGDGKSHVPLSVY